MLFPCTQAQFEAALAALKAYPGVDVTPNPDVDNGAVTSSKVDFNFSFNGTHLMILPIKKHPPFECLSDGLMCAHIHDGLMQVKA
jgi:hypothetical protein